MVKMMKLFLSLALVLSAFLFVPHQALAANEIITSDKLITVDLGKQMLYAWEGGKIVHETKVSTGMNLTPTVRGSFKIQRKKVKDNMQGPSPYRNVYPTGRYFIKDVPHTMYFYQGYAIHGAYWHNNFGVRASHGCVNVPLASAEWLFNWANLGTRVEVF